MLLSSEAGGVGLNLQNASVVMNLDLPWNPAKLEQRIARAWRKKQSREVLVINLVAEGTIEQRILGTLKFKQGLADMVLDARGDASDFVELVRKGYALDSGDEKDELREYLSYHREEILNAEIDEIPPIFDYRRKDKSLAHSFR